MTGGATGRDIAVKMKFSADTGQAKTAMGDLQKQAQTSHGAFEKLNDQMSGGGKDAANRIAFWGKLAFGVYAVTKAIQAATQAMRIWGDESLTTGQKIGKTFDKIVEAIPLLGGVAKAGREAVVEGRFGDQIRAMNKANEAFALREGKAAAAGPFEIKESDAIRAIRIARYDAGSFDLNKSILGASAGFGLSNKMMEDQGVRSALQAKIDAERGLDAARRTGSFDRANMGKARKGYNEAWDQLQAAENRMGGEKTVFEQLKNQAGVLGAMNELTRKRAELERQVGLAKESATAIAQREFEVSRASNEVLKAKLGLLRQQEVESKAHAQQFGMLGAGERLAVQTALNDAQRIGFENISADRRQLLASTGLTSEFANKEASKFIQDDATYKSIVGQLGQKTARQIEAEVKELSTKVEVSVEIDKKALADTMRKVISELLGDVRDLAVDGAKQESKRIEIQMEQKKAAERVANP